jgi:hypothetical protein
MVENKLKYFIVKIYQINLFYVTINNYELLVLGRLEWLENHYLHCYKIIATYLATILERWINGWSLDELVGWSLDIEGSRKIQGGCFIW